jgi:O-Antigen ligase
MKKEIAGTASAMLVIAFQLQLLTFFSPLFVQNKTIWPASYYAFWIFIIGSTAFSYPKERPWPVMLLCGALIAMTSWYPVDVIAKNFIVAMVFVICASALATAAGSLKILKLCAAATALNSCIVLADILFVHDLITNGADRAVGLSFNPNLAAIGMLLGATATYRAVPIHLIPYFVVLVGFAIFATLSKSVLLAFTVIFGAVAFVHLLRRRPIPGLAGPAVLVLALVTYLGVAWSLNYGFVLATSNTFRGIGTALSAFETARTSSAAAAAARRDQPLPSAGQIGEVGSGNHILIEEIRRRAENESHINSISARVLFMEQAWLAYRDGPPFGIGLDGAHAFAPHNSFLLFALAFGPIGWIIPLAFISLIWRNAPLALAVFAASMVSHDIFLMPSLLAPIAFGLAHRNLRNGVPSEPNDIAKK